MEPLIQQLVSVTLDRTTNLKRSLKVKTTVFSLLFFLYLFASAQNSRGPILPSKNGFWKDAEIIPFKTKIRYQHIIELRNAIDLKRQACSLPSKNWTDSSLSKEIKVRKVHFEELQSAVIEIATAKGLNLNYKNQEILEKTKIGAQHFRSLRDAISTIDCAIIVASTTPPVSSQPLPNPTNINLCGHASGTHASSPPTSGLCSSGTASAVTWVDLGVSEQAGLYRWSCSIGSYSESCVSSSPPCGDTGPKTWMVGSKTCSGYYFSGSWVAPAGNYPLTSGKATYACQSDGSWSSAPISATCDDSPPSSCWGFLDAHWGSGGNCYKYTPQADIQHGDTYTYTDSIPPYTGSWTVRCNNGVFTTVSEDCKL